MNNKVSIIIPIFNGENTIKYCLNSIVKQAYKNFEVIMVNDGSTDNTESICQYFEKKDDRFKYYFKKNGGVSSARNFGLSKCNGEYVSFVDCDDYLDENFLKILIENMIEYDCNISVCRINKVNELSIACNKGNNNSNDIHLFDYNEFLINLVNGAGMTSGCLNKLYKKKMLDGISFGQAAVAEDLYFNYELVKNNSYNIKVVYCTSKLYNYYIGSNTSVTHGKFSKKNLDVLSQYYKLISDSHEFSDFNIWLKNSLVFVSIKLIIKMVSSEYYDQDKYSECINIIDEYKMNVLKSKNYPITKKLFLVFFWTFRKRIMSSYNKNNMIKKILIYLNKKVG